MSPTTACASGGHLELDDGDRTSLLNVFDALITKSRVKALAGGITEP